MGNARITKSQARTQGLKIAELMREGSASIEDGVDKALVKFALLVERGAKQNAAVDTGRMRASITHRLIKTGHRRVAQVGTRVKYAKPQEFGTRYMSGKPFLRPSMNQNRRQGRDIVRKAIRDELAKR
jgi:HK97 gp10 family phage protein